MATKSPARMSPRPRVFVQMSGAPGAGKSTTAELLGRKIGAVVIDHDLLKSSFLERGTGWNDANDDAFYFDRIIAESMMKQGWSVIVDSSCIFPGVLELGEKLARDYGYDYLYVECAVEDLDLLDRRLRGRVSMRCQRAGLDVPPPDANVPPGTEDYIALYRRWIDHPCRPKNKSVTITLSQTATPEERVAQILKHLAIPKPVVREEGLYGLTTPSPGYTTH